MIKSKVAFGIDSKIKMV